MVSLIVHVLFVSLFCAENVVSRLVSGESCTISQDVPTAHRCNPWLSCDVCPEGDPQNYVCQAVPQFQGIH